MTRQFAMSIHITLQANQAFSFHVILLMFRLQTLKAKPKEENFNVQLSERKIVDVNSDVIASLCSRRILALGALNY
ncbi:CLUMA_CG018405, isoform A [Clunio marinus]|uniref:CLUMA_CG018405, isoform A n=1 Tax=Clunio marinus TaxID=568069 RepID=A0A1J1IZ26_9DIPT|nr:CLUMA_CG018405, isoform A [Clunio marinus]